MPILNNGWTSDTLIPPAVRGLINTDIGGLNAPPPPAPPDTNPFHNPTLVDRLSKMTDAQLQQYLLNNRPSSDDPFKSWMYLSKNGLTPVKQFRNLLTAAQVNPYKAPAATGPVQPTAGNGATTASAPTNGPAPWNKGFSPSAPAANGLASWDRNLNPLAPASANTTTFGFTPQGSAATTQPVSGDPNWNGQNFQVVMPSSLQNPAATSGWIPGPGVGFAAGLNSAKPQSGLNQPIYGQNGFLTIPPTSKTPIGMIDQTGPKAIPGMPLGQSGDPFYGTFWQAPGSV